MCVVQRNSSAQRCISRTKYSESPGSVRAGAEIPHKSDADDGKCFSWKSLWIESKRLNWRSRSNSKGLFAVNPVGEFTQSAITARVAGMEVCLLKSKIHRATITDGNIEYEGNLTIA